MSRAYAPATAKTATLKLTLYAEGRCPPRLYRQHCSRVTAVTAVAWMAKKTSLAWMAGMLPLCRIAYCSRMPSCQYSALL
jgi:hypothetical protein